MSCPLFHVSVKKFMPIKNTGYLIIFIGASFEIVEECEEICGNCHIPF